MKSPLSAVRCPLLALVLLSAAAQAQSLIEIPATIKLGEPIVASVKLPDGGKVAWKAGDGTSLIDAGLGRCYIWAAPGTYRIEAVVVSVADGQLGALEWLEATYTVEGSGPQPEPEPEPEPNPTPNPPQPEPQPGTLAALVPVAEHRALIAEFYADWATMIRAGMLSSTGDFRTAQQRAALALKATAKLPDYPALNKPISDRLAAAIGLADAPLDAAKRAALVAALEAISRELKGG